MTDATDPVEAMAQTVQDALDDASHKNGCGCDEWPTGCAGWGLGRGSIGFTHGPADVIAALVALGAAMPDEAAKLRGEADAGREALRAQIDAGAAAGLTHADLGQRSRNQLATLALAQMGQVRLLQQEWAASEAENARLQAGEVTAMEVRRLQAEVEALGAKIGVVCDVLRGTQEQRDALREQVADALRLAADATAHNIHVHKGSLATDSLCVPECRSFAVWTLNPREIEAALNPAAESHEEAAR